MQFVCLLSWHSWYLLLCNKPTQNLIACSEHMLFSHKYAIWAKLSRILWLVSAPFGVSTTAIDTGCGPRRLTQLKLWLNTYT